MAPQTKDRAAQARGPAAASDNTARGRRFAMGTTYRVSSKDLGLGQFVLGDLKVRPKMDATFATGETMGVFLQVYNLAMDPGTKKPNANVEYRI